MVEKKKIDEILSGYRKFTIATICSHSSLQIFQSARLEGIKTVGLVLKDKKALYDFHWQSPTSSSLLTITAKSRLMSSSRESP